MKAILALADGRTFEGIGFGTEGEAVGEVVFNTSMTGYQEILTDPSYEGQLVAMTYPEIGNVGVNPDDVESRKPFVNGFIVKDYTARPSNWRAAKTVSSEFTVSTHDRWSDTCVITVHKKESFRPRPEILASWSRKQKRRLG
jgi:carbamoyl-phosphate synthase small subunit